MKYGDWELRKYSAYWNSPNILLYPSTNSVDEGSLHTENNVRSIVRRLTDKNFILRDEYFRLEIAEDRKRVIIHPGEANIQGYHLITNKTLEIEVPDLGESALGTDAPIRQWTLGISLCYDAANHVTGDVVVNDKPIGENETFSGAYAYFFDKCQINNNYDQILILGRIWAQNGEIVSDGTTISEIQQDGDDNTDAGRYIEHGLEIDPHRMNAIEGIDVEVKVEGMQTTQYDTIPQNITIIKQYDSMLNRVELDRNKYSKPPTFVTNLQHYLNYLGDWYVNKYGDYMTGALRMDQLSIDRKIELDREHETEYRKDTSGIGTELNGRYHGTESIFISPRTLGKLGYKESHDYTNGGTIMTVVPQSYTNGLDYNGGYTGNYAALISRKFEDTGMVLHSLDGGYSRIVHYFGSHNLLIENGPNISESSIDNNASIDFVNGEMFFDSFNARGFQFYSGSPSSSTAKNLDFRIDEYTLSAAEHNVDDHRKNTRANKVLLGHNNDTKHIELGVGIGYDSNKNSVNKPANNNDAYLQLGNLRLRSNSTKTYFGEPTTQVKLNTIEVVDTNGVEGQQNLNSGLRNIIRTEKGNTYPYIRLIPGIYTRNGIAEDYLQVGTRIVDDIQNGDANENTLDKVVIGKYHSSNESQSIEDYTFIEQDMRCTINDSLNNQIFMKSVPFTTIPSADGNDENYDTHYSEIGGIYSYGNIGCSSAQIPQWCGRDKNTGPYRNDQEWVRFTRYRYDKDNDTTYSGSDISKNHKKIYGNTYNIEFNTNVANHRSNQIIWNYKGGEAEEDQPLILSCVHDKITDYPNSTYQDANGYLHQNPTYGVRNFLRLDGGGLSIHGDINNPALSEVVEGDSRPDSNPENRYGITLIHGRIYNGVYNDVAETYMKDNSEEEAVEGMVVTLNPETGKYRICNKYEDNLVVGVISKNYAMLLGGKSIDHTIDLIELDNQMKYFAVGITGKIPVNVDCDVKPGDLLVSSHKYGLATVQNKNSIVPGTIIGKALSASHEIEGKEYKRCLMQIMLS